MVEDLNGQLDGDSLEAGQSGIEIGSVRIEDNEPDRGSILDKLRTIGRSDDSERTAPDDDRGAAPKRRGRPKGSKNALSFETEKSAVSGGFRRTIAGTLQYFGHSMAKLYAPYGDFWEYDKEELAILSTFGDNIAKQTIGNPESASLKVSIICLAAIGGIGLATRAWQTYTLTQAIKAQVASQQRVSYQGANNPNVQQAQQRQQAPAPEPSGAANEYADLLMDAMQRDDRL